MTPLPLVEQVSPFVAQRDWERVRDALSGVDPSVLDRDGGALELLAEASWWLGRVDECIEVRRRALRRYEQVGDRIGAARIALLLSEDHRRQSHGAVADTWRRRAAQLLDGQPESVEHGYLRLYEGERARRLGELDAARALLDDAAAVAERVGDTDFAADVTQETGRLMILRGAHVEGLALMDEAMLAASEGGLSAYTTGKVYCCVLSACDDLGDVRRMTEWEQTSSAWSRRDGVDVFPGMCRVHHADLLAHLGQWSDAEREAERACEELREVGWIVAYAYNTLGQIRRRRGDLDGAARALTRAEELGARSDEGQAMLLLARGDIAAAMRRMARALAAASPPLARARLLPTASEIAVAAGDAAVASDAVVELEAIAAEYGTAKLVASASLARARLCLLERDWAAAGAHANVAVRQWLELAAPYEVARARVLHAHACRELDDRDGCDTALDIAAATFRALGAVPDLTAAERIRHRGLDGGPLTPREVEVLRLVATGATNKAIASSLIVSDKTVARHLSNIFTKLGVSTRTAATAYAYERNLVSAQSTPNRSTTNTSVSLPLITPPAPCAP